MIVERKDTERQEFGKLDLGQFFESEGKVFVKFRGTSGGINALNCDENFPVHFMPFVKVTPLNGKVVIE